MNYPTRLLESHDQPGLLSPTPPVRTRSIIPAHAEIPVHYLPADGHWLEAGRLNPPRPSLGRIRHCRPLATPPRPTRRLDADRPPGFRAARHGRPPTDHRAPRQPASRPQAQRSPSRRLQIRRPRWLAPDSRCAAARRTAITDGSDVGLVYPVPVSRRASPPLNTRTIA